MRTGLVVIALSSPRSASFVGRGTSVAPYARVRQNLFVRTE